MNAETKQEIDTVRARAESQEQTLASHKKMLAMLDEKIKAVGKAAAMGGGGGNAAQLSGVFADSDLGDDLAKLRQEFEAHRGEAQKHMNHVNQELPLKAYKSELEDLEARMLQRMQDLFDQLRGMFPDKEALNKKLKQLEKQVSYAFLAIPGSRLKFSFFPF